MPVYEYEAFTPSGEKRVGILDADTPRDARFKLRRDNVHVVGLRPVEKERRRRLRLRLGGGRGLVQSRRTLEETATVTRQLATLLAAGIPLTETLRAVIEQASSRRLEATFRDLREKVTQGSMFADALALHPDYFSELYVNMVRAGEASGNIDIVLSRLSDFIASQRRLREKVSAALTYPVVMLIIGTLVVTVLMTFVVPQITKMIASAGQVLPLPTKALILVSEFLYRFWWVLALAVAAVSWSVNAVYRTEKGRLAIDTFLLRIPVVGELLRKQAVARFTTTFSTLLKSGIPVTRCLEIAPSILNNRVLSNVLAEVRERIVEGADIATPLKRSGAFPPLVGYMIAVGEQSGQLEQMLDKVAAAYDEEIDVATQKLTSLIEPILIVLLAVIVGFIVLSIIWPILQIGKVAGV
ncbi:MAG TPA: type II secretion system inner membrane protein GspF [Planctomycetota bacterium]|nr:type II secretion system inner membrane protein GspF [Planctomycetota bacterium]